MQSCIGKILPAVLETVDVAAVLLGHESRLIFIIIIYYLIIDSKHVYRQVTSATTVDTIYIGLYLATTAGRLYQAVLKQFASITAHLSFVASHNIRLRITNDQKIHCFSA